MADLTPEEHRLLATDPMFRAGATAEARVRKAAREASGLGKLYDILDAYASRQSPPSIPRVVRTLARLYPTRHRMKVTVRFLWFDLWVGVFVDRPKSTVYICPLPCLVIKIVRSEVTA